MSLDSNIIANFAKIQIEFEGSTLVFKALIREFSCIPETQFFDYENAAGSSYKIPGLKSYTLELSADVLEEPVCVELESGIQPDSDVEEMVARLQEITRSVDKINKR